MSRSSHRRKFLKQTAAAGLGFWVAGGLSPAADSKSPNDKLNIACIGVGGKGDSDVNDAAAFGNIVALCDIDDNRLQAKGKQDLYAKAQKFHDFREMLDKLGKQIDAVTVSTADHTHAPASVMAMKMGKHVYCQKPLTHTVYEARVMRETAAKLNVCTQMGNQGTAENGLREAVEVIQAGAIGPVREVHIWTNRPFKYWKQAPDIVARPKEMPPIPKHVHWDLFLGPAPDRPYHGNYHPHNWRGWWDFGTGALGDMGCHTANMAFMALKLGHPKSISAVSSEVNSETYPAWSVITYEFPARGDLPPVKVTWYEGAKDGKRVLPPEEVQKKVLNPNETISTSGSILIGDKGILFSPNDYGAYYRLLPAKEFAGYKKPSPTLPRNGKGDRGHKEEWVAAIKASKPTLALSNFGYAGMLTEFILLGNVAVRAGKKLEFDAPGLKITNAPEVNKFLRTEYRKGWTL